jgi:uncharacterized repeat protein (TIGR01451 family)
MKRNSIKLLTAALLLATGQQAFAAATGTLAGQVVTNQASVSYTVNSVTQTAVVNDPKAAFTVDRKVNLLVTANEKITPADVTPKSNDQVLTYSVQNLTNDTMDFSLDAVNAASGDDFNVGNVRYFVDNTTPGQGTIGVYDPGIDTATTIDNLASGDSIAVFVLSDIPDTNGTTIVDGKKSGITLSATALTSAGAAITNDTGADTDSTGGAPGYVAGAIQNVFADDDEVGDTTGNRNGIDADTGYYKIVTTAISVAKTSFVMWDPINQYTNPKAIPGAVVVYCITVTNPSTTVPATSIAISDVIDTQVTYNAGSIGLKVFNAGEDTIPSCNAASLINVAGDADPTTGDAAYQVFTGGDLKTDAQPDADGGAYVGGGTHTVYADTPNLETDGSGAGHSNVAMSVFRVTIN